MIEENLRLIGQKVKLISPKTIRVFYDDFDTLAFGCLRIFTHLNNYNLYVLRNIASLLWPSDNVDNMYIRPGLPLFRLFH